MRKLFLFVLIFLFALASKAEYNAVTFYVVAHQDDWQLFMGANAYYDILNKDAKSVFIYTTSGCSGYIGDQGNGEGYGACTSCTIPYFKARELGAISSIQLINPPSRVWKWCSCWPYPPITEESFFVNDKTWYVKKYVHCNTVSYFLRIEDDSFLKLKNGTNVLTSIEDENDHQNIFRNWSDFTSLLRKIIIFEQGGHTSFWLNTHEADTIINPKDHKDHISTGLACQEATIGLRVNFNYYIGYHSGLLEPNLSPDAAAIESGLLAAYNKPKIDAGWWDDWDPSKGWCSRNYNRIVYDTTHSSIELNNINNEHYSITCFVNPIFDNKLVIKYTLPETKYIKIELINSAGFVLALIENESIRTKGQHETEFDISDYPCGLYFVRLVSDGEIITTGKFLKR